VIFVAFCSTILRALLLEAVDSEERLQVRVFLRSLRSFAAIHILHRPRALRCAQVRTDGPYFNRLAELEAEALFGYLHGLFRTAPHARYSQALVLKVAICAIVPLY
jgi:hypothetical protein